MIIVNCVLVKAHAKTLQPANHYRKIQTKTKDLFVSVQNHFMENIVRDGVRFYKPSK